MPRPERTAAILVAAGRGLRAGAGGPKQYREIGGQTVIFRAMQAFCRHPDVFAVQPVVNPDDAAIFNEAVAGLRHQPPANGGATRQASVHAGLEANEAVAVGAQFLIDSESRLRATTGEGPSHAGH